MEEWYYRKTGKPAPTIKRFAQFETSARFQMSLTKAYFLKGWPIKHIPEVTLTDSEITDEMFAAIGEMPLLHTLSLRNTPVTDQVITSIFDQAPNVRFFDLSMTQIKGHHNFEHFSRIARPPINGSRINLSHTPLDNQGLKNLLDAVADVETYLDITYTQITDLPTSTLQKLHQINHGSFDFSGTQISEKTLLNLPSNTRNITLTDTPVDLTKWLIQTALLPNLSLFVFKSSNFQDAHLKHLVQKAPNLRVLHLASTSVTAEGLRALTELPKLEGLNIRDTPVDESSIETIRKLDKLAWLYLPETIDTSKPNWRELLSKGTFELYDH